MSRSERGAFDKAHAGRRHDPVYDFLYHDARRIYSFLGQLDPSGHLIGIKQSETASETEGEEGTIQTTANIAVVKGTFGHKRAQSSAGGEAVERAYDPLWANALEFRDYLLNHDLVRLGLDDARIGQFVLVSGSLTVLDLTLFKGLWSVPAVRDAILASEAATRVSDKPALARSNRHDRRAREGRTDHQSSSSSKSPVDTIVDGALAVVGMLPHTIQVRVTLGQGGPVIWASLREESLVVSAADITLKHGAAIAGEWSMLGVLDAFPDSDADGNLTPSGIEGAMSTLSLSDSPFGQMMFQIMPHIRPLLGRPFAAYGMTPLLIFREVSA